MKSIGVLASLFASVMGKSSGQIDRPNIVMLFVDDLGYGDLGFTGHPTTSTPNIDRLAKNGKILSTWYSGCPVCSGSRAALMTGRQYTRTGVPGVFFSVTSAGLPTNETTVADQAKKAGYTTAMMGKWHLGQREMFLPGARGFDHYLGIPYSDDMGKGRATPCTGPESEANYNETFVFEDDARHYKEAGFVNEETEVDDDPAAQYLPLVAQDHGKTRVVEQPLDLTTLADKYNDYVQEFLTNQSYTKDPFFLYMAFSHVHVTATNQPERQYSGCAFQCATRRGKFGDALAEVDWLVGNLVESLEEKGMDKNTLILFTSDNGPWLLRGKSGGSPGLFYARTAGYWNVGKGSTWEGGIREPAFAYWPGVIEPESKSTEVVSSLDLFPTISSLLGVEMPDRPYDGKDMSSVLFEKDGKSLHEFLFFYSGFKEPNSTSAMCHGPRAGVRGPAAVRYGKYKAHFCTSPGLGGCDHCPTIFHDPPLLFNIDADPSEAYPLTANGKQPTDPKVKKVIDEINAALEKELNTFTFGNLVSPPPLPSEKYDGKYMYGVCCDRSKNCKCDGEPSTTVG